MPTGQPSSQRTQQTNPPFPQPTPVSSPAPTATAEPAYSRANIRAGLRASGFLPLRQAAAPNSRCGPEITSQITAPTSKPSKPHGKPNQYHVINPLRRSQLNASSPSVTHASGPTLGLRSVSIAGYFAALCWAARSGWRLAFASSTSWSNVAGSWMATSESALRSSATIARCKPWMNSL